MFADNGASSSIGATYPGRSADAIQPPGTGDPFERVPVGKIQVSPQEIAIAEPFMGVAIGLALSEVNS